MSQLPPNRDSFSSVREYSQVCHPTEPVGPGEGKVRPVVGDTQEDEKRDPICDLFQRRAPKTFVHQEISFEKNFLAQHIKTFDAISQKLKESMPDVRSPLRPDSNRFLLSTAPINISIKLALSLIQSLRTELGEMTQAQFIKDLKRQPNLEGFLDYVVGHCQRQQGAPLMVVAAEAWAEVRSLNLQQLEIKDFRRMAGSRTAKKAASYFERVDFLGLTGRTDPPQDCRRQKELFQKFRETLRRFITTVMLIVGGFFQNPYSEPASDNQHCDDVDYPKRQSSSVSICFLSRDDFFSESEEIPSRRRMPKGNDSPI